MKHNQQPQKKENLKIQSSVYPEGWGTGTQNFNDTFKHIHAEAAKASKDPRHYKTEARGAFCLN